MEQAINEWGYRLVDCIKMTDRELKNNQIYIPITCTLIFVESSGKYLIGLHKSRNQWEIPGGSIEKGETPKECAIRELFEETNQVIDDPQLVGLAKLFNSNSGLTEYLAVYHKVLNNLTPFDENEEMKEIKFWNPKEDIEEFDNIEKCIMDFCIENKPKS